MYKWVSSPENVKLTSIQVYQSAVSKILYIVIYILTSLGQKNPGILFGKNSYV